MPVLVVLSGVAAFLAVGVVAACRARSPVVARFVYGSSLAISIVLMIAAGYTLTGGAGGNRILPLGLPWTGVHVELDPLSAFFMAIVDLGAAGASLYALGHGVHAPFRARVVPFFPAFLGAMNLVVIAADAFTFLAAWEFMSLTSWALVVAHHIDAENRRAGFVYLVMAAFGTMALLLAFGLLAGTTGAYDFASIRATTPTPWISGVVLLLALAGTGSKAGLVPLHVWLPLAHPAAPSEVSALMSGVMTKVAVYGFIRIVFDLLGFPAWWWSMVVLALAGLTTVAGVLYALMQHDLKRLLAYHTVENIGIIFIGLGLALAFKAHGLVLAAALALTAGLLSVFNHSLFKTLLFFGAGAVLESTGERDMEHLGGLIHRMPQTAFVFLVGCVAISALPPLNGFVSEWLTFQAILLSPQLPVWGLKFLVPATGALLALAAALAAACFVKVFGVTFLGRPRTPAAEKAVETDVQALAAMFALAFLCLAAGIFPGVFIDMLAPIVNGLLGAHMPAQSGVAWLSIVPVAESRSSYNGLLVFLFMIISGCLAAFAIHRLASDRMRRGPAWDCGFPDPSPMTQYTASSFAQPIRRVFASALYRVEEKVEVPPPGDLRAAKLTITLADRIWDYLYMPIAAGVGFAAENLNKLQFLTIRLYLSLVFGALVTLLLVMAAWP